MKQKEYIIECISLDKKFLRSYLTYTDEEFQYPCMITLKSENGVKQYYVEQSNIRGHGYLIIDWSLTIKE